MGINHEQPFNQENTSQPELPPDEITRRSFAIVREELGTHTFSSDELPVVERVIHATADFALGKSLLFHPQAVQDGVSAIRRGERIVTDVRMVQAGISQALLKRFDNRVSCWVDDEQVIYTAQKEGLTRAAVAMRRAVCEGEAGLFVIGNAPTALSELVHLVTEEGFRPSLIVGVPVGFVSVEESKERLQKLRERVPNVPYITNSGRKGGSPVGCAIVNALAMLAGVDVTEKKA